MNFLILFFLVCLASTKLVTNETVEFYYDTLGGFYVNYEQDFINAIINPQDFHLSAGYHKAVFEIKNHAVKLIHFFPQTQKIEKADGAPFAPTFVTPIHIGIFRGANRNDTTKCVSLAKANEYVKYTELNQRIWSGNQIRIKLAYISSKCLVIDEQLYVAGKHGEINNALYAEAKRIDDVPLVASRWFINDDYLGGWLGLAVVGGQAKMANPKTNTWMICKINRDVEDPNNSKLLTIVHEFGHNCGFGHGGNVGASASGTFTSFVQYDNYNDGANFMGAYANWKHPIVVAQYWQVVVSKEPEPWLFKDLEEGIHKFRIYGIDDPYTRHYLGVDKANHEDSEVIDGIPFSKNCMAVRIVVDKTMTSKYSGEDGTKGYLMLEYRYDPEGAQGPREFGLRIVLGFGVKGNLLMANMDHLKSWSDSEVIVGVDYYPVDFDTGTLKMRVTKIHKHVIEGNFEEAVKDDTQRNYDEAGYAEVEIEYFPNRKPPKLTPPKELPNFIFSPSFHNCFKLDDGSGYNCSRSTTSNGWGYFINNGNRDKNYPRFYTQIKVAFIKGRNAFRSYNGLDYSKTIVCYGDNGFKCINITVNAVNYKGFSRKNYFNAKVTRYRVDDVNKTEEDLRIKNVVFGSGIEVPEGGRAYITDIYGNERDIKVIDKVFTEILPALETDGFSEGAVVVKDKSGKVTYYNGFTVYRPENGNRVAIGYNNGKFELSPAAIPGDKYSTIAGMLYPVTLKANNWFVYPIISLDYYDYVLIDFRGSVPSGLTLTVETDLGEYSKDLSDLGGLSSVSYKLTYKEINRATNGWAEIDRIKFNKDVEIQNIRPVYISKVGNQMAKVNAIKESFNFDGFRYTVDSPLTEGKYIYRKVSVEINGESYSFDSSTSSESVKSIGKKGLSTFVIVLIIVGVIIILIGLIYVVFKIKSKSSGSSRTYTQNSYASRPAYPPAGAASTYRAPPAPMGGTMPPRGPVAGGYSGGYSGGYRR